MFHKHLDQASKRYKYHPNVAATYITLPTERTNTLERIPSQDHIPKVRDFAYDQHDPETDTHDFIANFAVFGFQSHHRRVDNGDLLSKVGVPGYEKAKQLQDPSVDLKARFAGFAEMNNHPSQGRERPASEMTTTTTMDSVSSDVSGTTSATTGSPMEDSDKHNNDRAPRGIRDHPFCIAVTVCMLEHLK